MIAPRALALLIATPAAAAEPAPAPRPVPDRVLVAQALSSIGPYCGNGSVPVPQQLQADLARAEALRPALEYILADPRTEPDAVGLTFTYLANAGVGGPRFLDLALNRLADEESAVRRGAVEYLGRAGGPGESAPVVAMLSDKNVGVGYAAATALVRIGGRRDVAAMDAWLRSGAAHRDSGDYLTHVRKCRDELEKRLQDNPFPKGVKN